MPPLSFYLSVIAFFFFPSTCKFVYVCVKNVCVCVRLLQQQAALISHKIQEEKKKISLVLRVWRTVRWAYYAIMFMEANQFLHYCGTQWSRESISRVGIVWLKKKSCRKNIPAGKRKKKKTFSTPRRWGPPEREQAGFKPTSSIRN